MEGKNERIKWWDALDAITSCAVPLNVTDGVRLARECQHPDAQWLCSLFPGRDEVVTKEQMKTVMESQGEDPRALRICGELSSDEVPLPIKRAAELGYAPAQVSWSNYCEKVQQLLWLQKAWLRGSDSVYLLGYCLWSGDGCERDRTRAIALWKDAAELGYRDAQFDYGREAFSEEEWQRYRWWGLAAARGRVSAIGAVREAAALQIVLREKGTWSGRIVLELGAAFKGLVEVPRKTVFRSRSSDDALQAALQCIELHDMWLAEAKTAFQTWNGIGRRLKVAKDICLLIARLLWAEPWARSRVNIGR